MGWTNNEIMFIVAGGFATLFGDPGEILSMSGSVLFMLIALTALYYAITEGDYNE